MRRDSGRTPTTGRPQQDPSTAPYYVGASNGHTVPQFGEVPSRPWHWRPKTAAGSSLMMGSSEWLRLIPTAESVRVVLVAIVVVAITTAALYARELRRAAKREQGGREQSADLPDATARPPTAAVASPSRTPAFRRIRKSVARVSGLHGFFSPKKTQAVQFTGGELSMSPRHPRAAAGRSPTSGEPASEVELLGLADGEGGPAPLSASDEAVAAFDARRNEEALHHLDGFRRLVESELGLELRRDPDASRPTPAAYFATDDTLLRCLRARDSDEKAALDLLRSTISWR